MSEAFAFKRMQLKDLDELVHLHELYLNYGEGIRQHFEEVLRDPATIAVKAMQNETMVGLDIYTKGIALSGGHLDLCQRIRALVGDALVYTGDALLVIPDYRGQGLDAHMLAYCQERLRQSGARFVLYELWVHPDGRVPARHTVERYQHVIDLGFHRDFYIDFDHYGYFCPICGSHCKCSAHLYLCQVE